MGEGFELPHKDWKPLSLAPFFVYLYTEEFIKKYNKVDKLFDVFDFQQNDDNFEHNINLPHMYISITNGINIDELNLKIGFMGDVGEIYTSIEVNGEFDYDYFKFYEYADFHIKTGKNKNLNPLAEYPNFKLCPDIVFYALNQLEGNFKKALIQGGFQVHARVNSISSRNYEELPHTIAKTLKVTSWEHSIMEALDGTKFYDVHITFSNDLANGNNSNVISKRTRPQYLKAKELLKASYQMHPRLKNPALTNTKITDLVNKRLQKNEPTERAISRMIVVEAMNELWGKK